MISSVFLRMNTMRTVLCLILALTLHASVASQEPPAGDAHGPSLEQTVSRSLLDDFLNRIRRANYLQFSVHSTSTHSVGAMKRTEELDFDFAWCPENFEMTMRMKGETLRVVIEGDQMLMTLESKREYVLGAPPKNLGTFVGWLTNEPILKQFFRKPPFGGVDQLYTIHASKKMDHGDVCLDLSLAGTDLHVFLERDADGQSELRRTVADMSRGGNHPKGTHVTELCFTPILLNDTIPPHRFDLEPPRGFSQVDWFSTASDTNLPQVRSLKTLSGVPLPPFALERLGGDSVTLTALRGKQVILLDFWATWCRPCRSTLRTLDRLRERFGDKLYTLAVNVVEPREKVESFQKNFKLKSDIAFDKDGYLASELGVEFYPCTILIGLEGTIQAIHIGTNRLLERVLTEEITQVIAGNELIEGRIRYSAKERLYYRMALNATDYCNVFVNY